MVTGRLKSSSSKYVFALDVKMFSLESSLRCSVFLCHLLSCISNKHVNQQENDCCATKTYRVDVVQLRQEKTY